MARQTTHSTRGLHRLYTIYTEPSDLPTLQQLDLVLGTDLDSGKPVVLRGRDAALHKHVMGLSGFGKSKWAVMYFLQVLNQHRSAVLIDPAGDLAEDCLAMLHATGYFTEEAGEQAFSRCRYYDLSRHDRFLAYNVLNQPSMESRAVARAFVEATQRAWAQLAAGNAPMLENFLLTGSYVLAEHGEPITQLQPLLTDPGYRQRLLHDITDPQVLDFFARFAASDSHGGGRTMIESTLRRLLNLTWSPTLHFSLGQRDNRLPFRHLLDSGISLIFNLGGLDAETTRLLGCLLTVQLEEALLSRADLPEAERRGAHILIDEFSQFSAQSGVALERMLALTRKHGGCLVLIHQTFGQARELASALQNATFLSFRLGGDDAPYGAARVYTHDPARVKYSPHGHPSWMSEHEQQQEWVRTLTTLSPREAVLRTADRTLRLRTLPLPQLRASPAELAAIKEHYAQLYLTPKAEILQAAVGAASAAPAPATTARADQPAAAVHGSVQEPLATPRTLSDISRAFPPPTSPGPHVPDASSGPRPRRRVPLRESDHDRS